MRIIIKDWKDTSVEVEIPDDTEYISGVILSGDMVMEYPFRADSSNNRLQSFYDGSFRIEKKDFNLLESGEYDICDFMK